MPEECNTIEDLVFNRSFREWALGGEGPEAAFWEDWVRRHPEKAGMVHTARLILHTLQFKFKQLSDDEIHRQVEQVVAKLDGEPEEIREQARKRRFSRAAKVTVVTALLLIGWFAYRFTGGKDRQENNPVQAMEKIARPVEQNNTGDSTRRLSLPDGSRVWLEKNSHLRFARRFSASRRDVYLTGEAFFEVQKDPSRPFTVYTSTMITKVLGTSFRIRAYDSDKKAIVMVKTGKVSVFKRPPLGDIDRPESAAGGIVAIPNQAVVYDRESHELSKTLIDTPALVTRPPGKAFVFEATPISEVFGRLEDAYGIPIVYDEDVMSGCSLSATMGNESFYEKLDIICKAINASYERMDGTIVITSKGCK